MQGLRIQVHACKLTSVCGTRVLLRISVTQAVRSLLRRRTPDTEGVAGSQVGHARRFKRNPLLE